VLHPFTGSYASVGEASLQGVTVATSEINAAGGILGHKLQIVHADTLGDPVDAVPAAEHMIATNHPAAVIGPGGLEIGSIQRIMDANKIPFEFEGGDTAFDNTTDPMLWRDSPSDLQEGVAMALYALQHGYKRAAFMMSSITTAQDFIPYIKGAYQAGGGTIVANETMTPGLTSYRSEVLKVVQSKAQVIFSQIEPPTAAVMTQNFKQIDNLAIPIVASDTSAAAEWIKAVTPAVANKAVVSCQGATATSPATTVFMKYFNQDFKGQQPLASALYSYDATMALALAIDKAGSTNGPTFAKDIPLVTTAPGTVVYDYKTALADIKAGKKINYDGASGSMDYNQFHNVFGPYELVKSNLSGVEQVTATISAAQLEKGTPKGL
jgi:branched-chain amino acid transport system substrate-binding protein